MKTTRERENKQRTQKERRIYSGKKCEGDKESEGEKMR